MRHLTGSLDVWTGTQVPPLVAHVVDGDRFGLDCIQNLHLEGLSQRLDASSGLLPFFRVERYHVRRDAIGKTQPCL